MEVTAYHAAEAMRPRITKLWIDGIRTLEPFVLFGENGSGKSTLIEACELLRPITTRQFFNEFRSIHAGDASLTRFGSGHVELGALVEHEHWAAVFNIRFGRDGISREYLRVVRQHNHIADVKLIERLGDNLRIAGTCDSHLTAIAVYGWTHSQPTVQYVVNALNRMDGQLPFNTLLPRPTQESCQPLAGHFSTC